MPGQSDAIRQQDHPTVLEATEQAFIQAAVLASQLASMLENIRAGSEDGKFRDFRESLRFLYFMTSDISSGFNTDNAELIKNLETWLSGMNGTTHTERARKGIGLFNDYRKALMSSGIITLKR